MLGETELRVLEELDVPRSRQGLAEVCDYTPNTVSRAVETLESMNLVVRDQSGGTTTIRPAEAKCVEVYHSLVKANSHIDFPDLLTKNMLILLYYLNEEEWKQVKILAAESGLSRSTIYRHLKTLRNRAIAMKDHGLYRLSESFAELHTFTRELYHQSHLTQIKRDATGGTIIWESHDEILFRTDGPVTKSNYHLTGLDAFEIYDLHFFTTSEYYYFYSQQKDSLLPADLVCHLLLIENDSRHRQYALLLVAATETSSEQVRTRAEFYGLSEKIDPLLQYFDSRGENMAERTPQWNEFQSLADDYGVSL